VKWLRKTRSASFAGATVAGDLVVVASIDGLVSLYERSTGKLVRTLRLPAGTNATPAVTHDELFFGAGLPTGGDDQTALVAYKLR
jgi:outer membrane protein assembly factor BamB